jgi:hypothetical protein
MQEQECQISGRQGVAKGTPQAARRARTVVSMPMTLLPWPSSVMPKQPGRDRASIPSR